MKSLKCVTLLAAVALLSACEKESGTADADAPATSMLTAKGLDPADKHFVLKLADRIADYANVDDTPESVDRLRALPEHWRYIEPLIYYYTEVNDGGHAQYFANSEGVYRDLLTEGMKYYHADAFARNYAEALARYKAESDPQKKFSTEYYDKQDSAFYKIKPDLAEVLSIEIKQNLDKFK